MTQHAIPDAIRAWTTTLLDVAGAGIGRQFAIGAKEAPV
jgi:hypothetical protein